VSAPETETGAVVNPPLGVRKKVRKSARWSALGGGVVAIVDFLQVTVLARIVGPEAYGLMAAVLVVIGFSRIIGRMGFTESLIHHQNVTRAELDSVYWLNIASGLLMWAACTLAAPLVSSAMNLPLTGLLRATAYVLLLDAAGSQFDALFRKELNFRLVSMIEILSLVVGTTVAITYALYFHGGAFALVAGHLTRAATRLVMFLALAARAGWLPGFAFRLADAARHLAFGGYRTGAMVAIYVANRADQVLVGSLMGAQPLGYYNLAFQIAREPISKTTPVINNLALPAFAMVQDDRAKVRRGYLDMIGIMMMVTAPLFIGMGVVAPFVVPTLLGVQWAPAVPLIQVLVVFALFASVNNATGPVIWATGHARWSFWWNTAMMFLKPLVLIPCALTGDVMNVAWGMLGLGLATLVGSYWFRLRRVVGPIGRELFVLVAVPAALATAMGGVVHIVGQVVSRAGVPPIPTIAIMVASGALVYFALVRRFRKEQYGQAMAIVRERRSPRRRNPPHEVEAGDVRQ
jgi:O-antigen/teichoic acid export membrane protein